MATSNRLQAKNEAAHRERVQDKLHEKLERVSLMEERRNVLMDHLAALRRDISDLDVGIRVSTCQQCPACPIQGMPRAIGAPDSARPMPHIYGVRILLAMCPALD